MNDRAIQTVPGKAPVPLKKSLACIWIAALLMSLSGCVSGGPTPAASPSIPHVLMVCDTLYLGLSTPTGEVSSSEWQEFLREVVTPRFPQGLTTWEADGQWRDRSGAVHRERTRVLQLIHEDDPKQNAALREIASRYKEMFHQESSLWVRSEVKVSF